MHVCNLSVPLHSYTYSRLTTFPAYLVESLPDVPFDVGELYGGQVPIDNSNASRNLFYMFQPTVGEPVDEVTIWCGNTPVPRCFQVTY